MSTCDKGAAANGTDLDDALVRHGFGRVEHDEDEVAGAADGNDLATATLAVLGALNDTGQIQQLNAAALVLERARTEQTINSRQPETA